VPSDEEDADAFDVHSTSREKESERKEGERQRKRKRESLAIPLSGGSKRIVPGRVLDRAGSPTSVEWGRGMSVERGHALLHLDDLNASSSTSRTWPGDDSTLDATLNHSQSVALDLRPESRPAPPPVDLDDVPNPKLTTDDLCVDLRAAIHNLAGCGRMNDKAVNAALQWEAKRATTGIVVESPSCFASSQRTRGRTDKVVIPVHHLDIEHWSIDFVDFGSRTVSHYDPLRDESRCSRVCRRTLDWMIAVDKSIIITDVTCRSKVGCNLFSYPFYF
jgi:hypothetical protein